MDYTYIEQLIARYFDCETSIAEERILKAFFSQDEVPAALRQYAPLFAYEDDERSNALDDDFDQRVLSRLKHDGDAPAIHVEIQRLTLADRLRPLMRAAAAVAIVVMVGGSLHHAYVTHPVEPISQYGTSLEADGEYATDGTDAYNPKQFIQEGEKVAITIDTAGVGYKVE